MYCANVSFATTLIRAVRIGSGINQMKKSCEFIQYRTSAITRVRVGGSKLISSAPVIGLLFGVQNGLTIEVMDESEACV
jgi:hypothetical protein